MRLTNLSPSDPRSNWNLEVLVFEEGGKPESPIQKRLIRTYHFVLPKIEQLKYSGFLEPPRETKIGSRNRELRNIGGKITVKTSPRETTSGNRGF